MLDDIFVAAGIIFMIAVVLRIVVWNLTTGLEMRLISLEHFSEARWSILRGFFVWFGVAIGLMAAGLMLRKEITASWGFIAFAALSVLIGIFLPFFRQARRKEGCSKSG